MKINKQLFGLIMLALLSIGLISCKTKEKIDKPEPQNPTPVENEYQTPEYAEESETPYTGLLESYKKDEWNGYWIWDKINAPDSYVAFRKEFEISKDITEAVIDISAESKYFMWVNGILTVYDGSSKRGPSVNDSFYDHVKITNLKKGKNVIAFLTVYNGRSSDSSIDAGKAGLLFEMSVDDKVIKSDNTVKVKRLREYKNKSLLKGDYPNYPQSSMLGEWNVYFDAREATGNFFETSFDVSSWDNAVGVAKAGAKPFNRLYKNPAPTMKFNEIVKFENSSKYENIIFDKPTKIELELPLNRQFSTYFEIESEKEGEKILLYTDTYVVGTETNFKDTYITKKGVQKYENYPWRSGSKLYMEIPSGVKISYIGYRASGYDADITGSFESSNERLNILWDKAVNSLLINMRDTFMDTPDRERAPYMGDASNQIEMLLYSLDPNSYEIVKKTILTAIGWTKEGNILVSRAPSKSPHEIPVQSLAFIISVYNYYLYTGDRDTISKFYEIAANYLKNWELKDNGLIEIRDGSWLWTDWGEKIDVEVIQTAWYYYALNIIEKLSSDLNITKNDEFISQRKVTIEENFAKVYQKEDGGFRSGEENDDRANALAVLSGLAKKEDYESIRNILVNTKNASPFYEKYVLEALSIMGYYDEAVTRMLDRYEAMIDDSGTTLWELWSLDAAGTVTVNHGWTGGPLVIMSKYIAGIKPIEVNYEEYEIIPQFIYDKINASVDTNKGVIKMSYNKVEDGYEIKIKAIEGTGYLKLPKEFKDRTNFTGVMIEVIDDDYYVLSFEEGNYTITVS